MVSDHNIHPVECSVVPVVEILVAILPSLILL
jgi:hypothetical protein